jgi:ubiquinone/menaquinone biosynthesis C-methylase UbiE
MVIIKFIFTGVIMKPKNLDEIQKSFTTQSQNHVAYSKGAFDDTVQSMNLTKDDCILDAAAGTCSFGRAAAPFVKTVICLDATPAMLAAGKEEAEKSGITNIQFINGYVDAIPFDDQYFDAVFTSNAFHHFLEMEKPFAEMHRVLKHGGQLVIKDMEATTEALRDIEDKIETMRDPSHVKNRSRNEFLTLYEKYGYTITEQEATKFSKSLSDWVALTKTPNDVVEEIKNMLKAEMQNGNLTGFYPHLQDGEIFFEQRFVFFIGKKT